MSKTVNPNAWNVTQVHHMTTGQTISPDTQTGDEWIVERRNPTVPTAVVLTTYGVTCYATDAEGNRVDDLDVNDDHAHWRYSVDEVTELYIGGNAEDVWEVEVWSDREYGDGSYLDYESEEAADRECERMARADAAMTDIITWDGQPFTH